jgi:hypothetical protein
MVEKKNTFDKYVKNQIIFEVYKLLRIKKIVATPYCNKGHSMLMYMNKALKPFIR